MLRNVAKWSLKANSNAINTQSVARRFSRPSILLLSPSACQWSRTRSSKPASAPHDPSKVIPDSWLSLYTTLSPPTSTELSYASAFFHRAPPTQLYIASALYQVPRSNLPEVAFLGRSNVGKSTLLNALLFDTICRTSSKPGRTRALHAYAVGGKNDRTAESGLIAVLDVPGYGHGSQEKWEITIARYLAKRKELRRAYVLVDAMHGLKSSDRDILAYLREKGIPHQVVLSKVDRLLFSTARTSKLDDGRKRVEDVMVEMNSIGQDAASGRSHGTPAVGEVLCVSAEPGQFRSWSKEPGGTLGMNALRWSVLKATGFEAFERKRVGKDEIAPEVVIDSTR